MKEQADRFNSGKPDWTLIDFDSLEPMVRVLEFGAKKYSRDNWKKGLYTTDIVASLMRHIIDYLNGNDLDKESQQEIVGHMMCNIMFLSYMKNKPEFDNRLNKKEMSKVTAYKSPDGKLFELEEDYLKHMNDSAIKTSIVARRSNESLDANKPRLNASYLKLFAHYTVDFINKVDKSPHHIIDIEFNNVVLEKVTVENIFPVNRDNVKKGYILNALKCTMNVTYSKGYNRAEGSLYQTLFGLPGINITSTSELIEYDDYVKGYYDVTLFVQDFPLIADVFNKYFEAKTAYEQQLAHFNQVIA